MKKLLLLVPLLLVGCSDFPPMSDAESKAYASCLEKSWEPMFQVTSSSRKLSCEKPEKK